MRVALEYDDTCQNFNYIALYGELVSVLLCVVHCIVFSSNSHTLFIAHMRLMFIHAIDKFFIHKIVLVWYISSWRIVREFNDLQLVICFQCLSQFMLNVSSR